MRRLAPGATPAAALLVRDEERVDRTTRARTPLSIAWRPQDDRRLDLFGIAGLKRDTPDFELAAGFAASRVSGRFDIRLQPPGSSRRGSRR